MKSKMMMSISAIIALNMGSQCYAASNTITFEGEITAATCDVIIEGQTTGTGTVNLPPVSSSILTGAGATAGRTDFALIAQNCDMGTSTYTKVATFFEGSNSGGADANNVDTASGYLNNTSTATTPATNVQLRLIDKTSNSVIKAGDTDQITSAGYVTIDTTGKTARMPYAVEYISVPGGATVGAVHGSVVYDLMYE
ncbi:fimbrial protein [Citrobacter sp. FP75]|uniref:fimbrial protein n=1 Tax=Citrobacter sp. FP75 TaxID=1852949 RepID=UPI001BC8E884|nr:fimbrial protein [Citrobacter sp. FP75]